MKKINVVTLIGAALCLVSMALSYVMFDALVLKYGLAWFTCARFVNYGLFAVPVIGVLMLLSAFVDAPAIKIVPVVLGIILSIYYMLTYTKIQNGDLIRYISMASPLLSSTIGITANDIRESLSIIAPFMRPALGAILFMGGTMVSLVGVFVGNVSTSSGSSARTTTNQPPRNRY